MKNLLIFSLSLFLSNACWAEKLCYKNKAEFDLIKDKLPELLQQDRIYFNAKTKILFVEVMAAGYLQFDSAGRVRFFFNCTHEVDKPIEEAVSVCVDSSNVVLTFDNTDTEKVVLKGNNEVLVRNKLTLKKVSKEEFTRSAKAIEEKLRGNNSKATPAETGSAKTEGAKQ